MPGKILIIDDDVDTLKLVGLMLQRQGYEISAASSGEQGLAKAFADKPDLILVDIMMPDMDGYEVTRRIRKEPSTHATPVLMFTARTQLDDKVTGFEVGADDYLTKPTHPTELQTHVRALLERGEQAQAVEAGPVRTGQRARVIAVLAARGGLGVSMVASNLAAALHTRTNLEVILGELTPGRGTLGGDLGVPNPKGLSELLTGKIEEITGSKVSSELVPHTSGLKLLLASENPRDVSLVSQTRQYEQLFTRLQDLARFVVLDLGTGLPPFAEKILPRCDDCIVVTEGSQSTIAHTRILLNAIVALGIDPKAINVVLNNRIRFDTQLPWAEVQDSLGHPIFATLTPAPEWLVAATRRRIPGVLSMPENVTAQQIIHIADRLLARELKA